MRAIAMIIMDKLERAHTLIKTISNQIYKPEVEAVVEQDSSLHSSVASGRKKLTSAEKEKLSIIKRKLQEQKQQRITA